MLSEVILTMGWCRGQKHPSRDPAPTTVAWCEENVVQAVPRDISRYNVLHMLTTNPGQNIKVPTAAVRFSLSSSHRSNGEGCKKLMRDSRARKDFFRVHVQV